MAADIDAIRAAVSGDSARKAGVQHNPTLPADYPPFMIANRTIPFELETRHMLMVGTPGSGKTQAIKQQLEIARLREAPAALLDHGGEMMQYFYRDGIDINLNPMDERCVGWTPFNELKRISDFKRVAKLLVPDSGGQNQDWTEGAQQVVSDTLRSLWNLGANFRKNEPLLYFLLKAPLHGIDNAESLEWLLRSTTSRRLFEVGNEKQLAITMGIISRHMEPLTYLREGDFSITDFVKSFEKKGVCRRWLFLSYTDDNYAAIGPLMAMWMEFVVQAGLLLSESALRRFYLVCDELGSLRAMKALYDALTKWRKFGGVVIAGLQSTAQIEDPDKYGEKGAQSLLSCFGTVLMLRVGDDQTAEKLSRILGDRKLQKESRSVSEGSSGWSDSTTTKEEVERLVLASNFGVLPDRTGYLRVAGMKGVYRMGMDATGAADPESMIPVSALPKISPKEITRKDVSLEWLDEQAAQLEMEVLPA
ncbi:hypothetical protein BGV71_32180 [Burkholderia ubonensis]|uniref:type IV secretion system DNA-binding domain-containing protein n=1 Tax=Burkholderia ubonensis TaxID=101571 RepID=UPI000914E416|nr:type IV secretion system DNA-binding domain-containing protein [Burkholderia ubonensis]OJA66155.1 hypothetical protein BGV71_32180 [Burkholderia ubonensis]